MDGKDIPTLEDLSLNRVFEDIPRHGTKFRDDSTNYQKFQSIFADNIVEMFYQKFVRHDEQSLEGYTRSLQQFADFVFNPFVKRIQEHSFRRYSPETIATISRNCKDLKSFYSVGMDRDLTVYHPILRNMKNLTVLNLELFQSLNVGTIEIIASSLKVLESLSLFATNINDDALFILCGHKRVDCEDIRSCCYTNECGMKSPLQLLNLNISSAQASKAGVACVLTHMPTLRDLITYPFKDVLHALCKIDRERKKCGMERLKVQLTSLWCLKFKGNWEAALGSCPELEKLELHISNDNSKCTEQMQAMCKLAHLRSISLSCERTDRLGENMKVFWTNKGHQLKFLSLKGEIGKKMSLDTKDLQYMLRMCPHLEELSLNYISLNCTALCNEPFQHIPCLRNLVNLEIQLEGEPRSMVVKEVFKIICEARNIKELTLTIPAEKTIVLDSLSKIDFHFLNKAVCIDSQTITRYLWVNKKFSHN